jgi:hypothetical protein
MSEGKVYYKNNTFVTHFDPGRPEPYSEGLSRIKMNDHYGFVDTKGNIVIKPDFNNAQSFSEGLVAVEYGAKFVNSVAKSDKELKEYAKRTWKNLPEETRKKSDWKKWKLEHGYWDDGKWGYIDKTGKFFIEPQFKLAKPFSNGLAAIQLLGKSFKIGYIDKTGKVVIDPLSDTSDHFNDEGVASITEYSKDHEQMDFRGYINTKGEYIWKPSR